MLYMYMYTTEQLHLSQQLSHSAVSTTTSGVGHRISTYLDRTVVSILCSMLHHDHITDTAAVCHQR
jgi:hypothetical protein